ncbi:hypothetical protein GCM10009831_23280 [Dietzia cercidiphylli]|uniref:Uncharacterized protein n=1 Tax=Dietzia cercidiphylli TaxID=498199 RepID=A0ABN2IW10_9ACTN
MSTVVRPVTDTADVAVKTASCSSGELPEDVAYGIISSAVNRAMAEANAASADLAGEL